MGPLYVKMRFPLFTSWLLPGSFFCVLRKNPQAVGVFSSLKRNQPMVLITTLSPFLLGWPIFRGELLVLERVLGESSQQSATMVIVIVPKTWGCGTPSKWHKYRGYQHIYLLPNTSFYKNNLNWIGQWSLLYDTKPNNAKLGTNFMASQPPQK